MLLLDTSFRTALLLGAAVASTDAAAVFSVLRRLPVTTAPALGPRGRVRPQRRPHGRARDPRQLGRWDEHRRVGGRRADRLRAAGRPAGRGGGRAGSAAAPSAASRCPAPASTRSPRSPWCCSLSAPPAALHASGFLAVYVAGLLVGSARLPHRRAVLGFATSLSLLAELALFVLLGLLADALAAGRRAPRGPGRRWPRRCCSPDRSRCWCRRRRSGCRGGEQAFLSWAGLRGAVPDRARHRAGHRRRAGRHRCARRRLRPRRRLHPGPGTHAAERSAAGSASSRTSRRATSRSRRRRSRAPAPTCSRCSSGRVRTCTASTSTS